MLHLAADPENDKLSLAEICSLGKVPIGKVMNLVKQAALTRAQLLSTLKVAEQLPDVAAAVMRDAIPGERPCQICQGIGTMMPEPTKENPNPSPVQCVACNGKGTQLYSPELGVRKVALQLGGLMERGDHSAKGITMIQTNLNKASASGEQSHYDKLVAVADTLLYGTGRDRMPTSRLAEDADYLDASGGTFDGTSGGVVEGIVEPSAEQQEKNDA